MTRSRPAASFFLTLVLLLVPAAAARSAAPQPRLVRVALSSQMPVTALVEAGLDVVHVRGAQEAQILEWPGDAAKLARLGVGAQVLDEHPGRTAALRARADLESRPAPAPRRVLSATAPDGVYRIHGLPAFGSGSMAGYWTSDEIKMKLDDLVASDANDVVADRIDTLGFSLQNRPIWGLKLGKRVTGLDTRPVAFFNALTHSREPEGMQALFYFVDDLLARYGADPLATFLLDHRVIYIVPLVNPDGYRINEDTYFGSGGTSVGYWRKNARDNNDNSTLDGDDGVDLNRNYGHQWGYDNVGSSGTPNHETYRGPAAFSEPETRAQRDIVSLLGPTTGFSIHTFTDLLIHPWSWTVTPTDDDPAFAEWSDLLTRRTAYLSGAAPVILYPVNGDFNDWAYGDTTKPRMFSWTPEIGNDNDGFWPPPSRIAPLAQENLESFYLVTAIAGPYVQVERVEILQGALIAGRNTSLAVRARNLGARGSAGPALTGRVTALDAGARVLLDFVSYPTLGPLESGESAAPFVVALDDTVTPGRLMRFQVDFGAPGLLARDTIAIPAGTPTVVAFDDASSGLVQWLPGSWGIVSNDPDHPSRYFADSPGGNYSSATDNRMTLASPLDLSAGVHAYAFYETRWEFEQDYDGAMVEASLDGSSWTPLWATGSTPASGIGSVQVPAGLPFYAGNRRLWKPERVDLSAFTGAAGSAVRFRFRARSDFAFQMDGIAFDSLRIVLFDPAAQPDPVAVSHEVPALLELAPPAPNPARGRARLSFALPHGGPTRLEILDIQGRRVRTLADGRLAAGRYAVGWDLRDDIGRAAPPGVYLARLSGEAETRSRRFIVLD